MKNQPEEEDQHEVEVNQDFSSCEFRILYPQLASQCVPLSSAIAAIKICKNNRSMLESARKMSRKLIGMTFLSLINFSFLF